MSENRFKDCETVGSVLWRFSTLSYTEAPAGITADALARIAELSARTVDAAGRERVREIVSGWVDGMQCHAVVNRIIDALGWTVAPKPKTSGGMVNLVPRVTAPKPETGEVDELDDEPTPSPVPPAPAVELDARQIQALNSVGNALAGTDLEILRVKILGVDAEFRQVFSRPDNPWVLRIGSGDD